jgi:uncharacterized YigZ family protein
MPSYLTITAPFSIEPPPTKKSRFVADAAPVCSVAEAKAFIESVQAKHPDAGHHCYAWRLQAGDSGWRVSDDGEPSGTAGMPILARIDGQGLRCIAVVVTRWFGGTKLGKGGLIRAYGGATSALLQGASLVEVRETLPLRVRFDYADQGTVQSVLRSMGLEAEATAYGEQVVLSLAVPVEDIVGFNAKVMDCTAGRAVILGL